MKTLEQLGISPVPWKVRNENSGVYIANADDAGVASLVRYYSNLECINADARLVASAPELYESLAAFVRFAETHAPLRDAVLNPIIDTARAALSKAAGESEVK